MARKKAKPTGVSANSYTAFLEELKLIAIGLSKCKASLDRAAYAEVMEKKTAPRRVASEYNLLDVGEDYFEVEAKFNLSVGNGNSGLEIECIFEAHFHANSPIERGLVERFTESELRVVMWPYFRQFVSDTTARMAIPPITIPLATGSTAS